MFLILAALSSLKISNYPQSCILLPNHLLPTERPHNIEQVLVTHDLAQLGPVRRLLSQNKHLIISSNHSPRLTFYFLFGIVQSEDISYNRLIIDFEPESM